MTRWIVDIVINSISFMHIFVSLYVNLPFEFAKFHLQRKSHSVECAISRAAGVGGGIQVGTVDIDAISHV